MGKVLIDIINFLIAQVGGILGTVIGLLPDSVIMLDFDSLSLGPIPAEWITALNFFLPVQEILWFLELVAGVLVVYYSRMVILRIVRLIK